MLQHNHDHNLSFMQPCIYAVLSVSQVVYGCHPAVPRANGESWIDMQDIAWRHATRAAHEHSSYPSEAVWQQPAHQLAAECIDGV